jgi:hypothetical protein
MAETNPSFRLLPPTEKPVQVQHLAAPPKFEKPKRIHARRVLPRVREGMERQFHSATLRAVIGRPLAMAAPRRAATDELVLSTNTELTGPAQQDTASNVGEPSTAINGQVAFFTGNWYAANSPDGGATFQYLNPATVFQQFDPPGSQFCCDQVVNYIPQIDTFVWLLQYGPEAGDNIQRLAFARTADVVGGKWRLFDITTKDLGVPGAFMDFPDLAVGANFLYVTTNLFGPGNKAGSAVVRLPIAGIQSGQVTAQKFVTYDLQSFRVAQSCGSTAFFAAHQDTSTLKLFSWDEGQDTPAGQTIGVARWIGGNGYQSRSPDGRRWLDRADPRITGATLAGNELWFAWSVDTGSNQRPGPFVQIARIDAGNLTLLENVNIFDQDSAICYGALNTNANNEVGISYAIGGGPRFPSHVVGILTGTRKDVMVAAGERGPLPDQQTGNGEWGDFLTVRPVYPSRALFAATGYTMKGPGDGSNRDCTPRFVIFGRSGDTGAAPAGGGGAGGVVTTGGGGVGGGGAVGAGGGGVGGPPPGGDGPFQDVNTLPVVSAEVAAKIKAAAGILQGPAMPSAEAAMLRPELVTKPGVERWPVKTGTDRDVATVGKNVINGQNLGAGIVDTTVEELISVPRPPYMSDPAQLNPDYQDRRAAPLEQTVWRFEGTITVLKLEADGDYHMVLQGVSGQTMIGEVPTPTTQFLGNSPWIANIGQARKALDDTFVKKLSPAAFVPMGKYLMPRGALTVQPQALPPLPASFVTPMEGSGMQMPLFQTQVTPTRARITGVGFFDKVHGQTGVSQSNGIELHPVLKIEWL